MRTRETNYSAFERSGIGFSFWSGEPLSPRAPSFKILVFFWYRRCAGACSNNILLGFVAPGRVVKGHVVGFPIDQRLLRKLDFVKN